MVYETILVEYPADGVGLVRLNQPRTYNALTGQLMDELMSALETMDASDNVRCMVITGSDKAFAADVLSSDGDCFVAWGGSAQ